MLLEIKRFLEKKKYNEVRIKVVKFFNNVVLFICIDYEYKIFMNFFMNIKVISIKF